MHDDAAAAGAAARSQSINFPAAVQQYGKKYIGVADQDYPTDLTGIWETKITGTSANANHAVVMGSTGCSTRWGQATPKPWPVDA